jgi:SNF2 family DNA or RNA helicase
MIHVLKIPEVEIIFIHKLLDAKKIDAALDKFHGDSNTNEQPRYVVATTTSFAVGLTLSEATGIGLLEPDYVLANELQAFCRHNRLGNKNKRTYSWL